MQEKLLKLHSSLYLQHTWNTSQKRKQPRGDKQNNFSNTFNILYFCCGSPLSLPVRWMLLAVLLPILSASAAVHRQQFTAACHWGFTQLAFWDTSVPHPPNISQKACILEDAPSLAMLWCWARHDLLGCFLSLWLYYKNHFIALYCSQADNFPTQRCLDWQEVGKRTAVESQVSPPFNVLSSIYWIPAYFPFQSLFTSDFLLPDILSSATEKYFDARLVSVETDVQLSS